MVQLRDDPQIAAALARSAVYRFLSLAFWPPGEGSAPADVPVPDLLSALAVLDESEAARSAADSLAALLAGPERPVLGREYHAVFGHQVLPDCPLNETHFASGQVFQQAQQLADIAGFYLAFGLDVAEDARERADHISLEMEFMQVLTFREAYARAHHGDVEATLLRDAQRAFLRDHLTRWIPVLARLIKRKTAGFYHHAADLADAWIAGEAAALGLPPLEGAEYAILTPADGNGPALPCGVEQCPLDPAP